jgi:hypothetical protein
LKTTLVGVDVSTTAISRRLDAGKRTAAFTRILRRVRTVSRAAGRVAIGA